MRRRLSWLLLPLVLSVQQPVPAHATNQDGRYTSRGFGNRSCRAFLASRSEDLEAGGFATWLSGFFTAINQVTDGTEDILAGGGGLAGAMDWMAARCRKNPSATFAAIAHVFVEAHRVSSDPASNQSASARLDAEASDAKSGSPTAREPPRARPPEANVQGRGLVALAPYQCRDTPQGGYVQRLCYEPKTADMLLQVGGIWVEFCGVGDKLAAGLTETGAIERFYRGDGHGFACKPRDMQPGEKPNGAKFPEN